MFLSFSCYFTLCHTHHHSGITCPTFFVKLCLGLFSYYIFYFLYYFMFHTKEHQRTPGILSFYFLMSTLYPSRWLEILQKHQSNIIGKAIFLFKFLLAPCSPFCDMYLLSWGQKVGFPKFLRANLYFLDILCDIGPQLIL